MIKAIIWDMDGVLIDSETHHVKAEIETFSKFGAKLTQKLNKKFSGMKLVPHFEQLSHHFGIEDQINEILSTHRNTLIKYAKEVFPLSPNVIEVLQKLSKKYLMALATSSEKEMAELVFHRFELNPYFKGLVVGEDVRNSKPHPEPFLKAAQLLGIKPNECIVVEDSINGFQGAKTAGMMLIARKAEHNKDLDFSLADFTVEDLNEIPKILTKLDD